MKSVRKLSTTCSLALTAALLSLSAAAQDGAPNNGGEEQQAEKAPQTTVNLIEAGEEPRTELRFRPSEDSTEHTEMRMKMRMTQSMNGMDMPPMALPQMRVFMQTAVNSPDERGDINLTTTIKKTELREERGINPMVRQQMEQSLRSMEGMVTRAVMSSRGIPTKVDVEMPGGADPMVRQQMEGMMGSFEQMAMPLPEEAVGKGAKWEVKTTIKQQGMTIRQTTIYTLKSIADNVIELDVKMAQTADEQDMESPMVPPGAKVRLLKWEGSGEGTSRLDLAKFMPVQSQMKSDARMEFSMSMGGQAQDMQQRMEMEMEMLEGKPEADDDDAAEDGDS